MNYSAGQAETIERIVREVLARLGRPAAAAGGCGCARKSAPASAPGSCGCHGEAKPEPKSPHELVLIEPVIGVRELRDRLDGVRRIRVSAKAIVTPAVRDLLKERKIELSVGGTSGSSNAQSPRVIIGIAETNFEPAPLVRTLARRGAQVEQLARTGLSTVVGELTDHVRRDGKRGLIFTAAAAAASCLANRVPAVRAVRANSADAVRREASEVGANVLVVSPDGHSQHAIERMVRAFLAQPGQCPEHLRARLG